MRLVWISALRPTEICANQPGKPLIFEVWSAAMAVKVAVASLLAASAARCVRIVLQGAVYRRHCMILPEVKVSMTRSCHNKKTTDRGRSAGGRVAERATYDVRCRAHACPTGISGSTRTVCRRASSCPQYSGRTLALRASNSATQNSNVRPHDSLSRR